MQIDENEINVNVLHFKIYMLKQYEFWNQFEVFEESTTLFLVILI